jgi:cardiolipin synthase
MLNLPNFFSLARIVLIFPFIYLLLNGCYGYALAVGFAAALTDLIDGTLARLLRQQTVLGTYLDPAADKLFMTASFITLTAAGLLPLWLTLLVIGRDVMIVLGVFILHLLSLSPEARPSLPSKVTTALQLGTIGAPLLSASVYPLPWLTAALVVVCAAATVFSGGQYIARGVSILKKGRDELS